MDQKKHSRKIYGALDLFGDFGGLMEVMLLVGGLMMSPISSFMFNIKAL